MIKLPPLRNPSSPHRAAGLLLLISLLVMGCQSLPPITPKAAARNITVAALAFSGADKKNATRVKEISLSVKEALDEDGALDRQALLAQVDEQIAKLDTRERAILMAIRSQVVDIVAQAIADDEDVTNVLIVIRQVADGTLEGAEIYLQSLEPVVDE